MKVGRVLVTPLDWGLGHASRCIPIIRELLKNNCEVMVGGSGDSLILLKNEFPVLKFFTLASYSPVYSTSSSLVWKMGQQLFKFIKAINQEHRQVEQLVKNEKIDLLISDNRYGCWSRNTKSIIITHQLTILLPREVKWMEGFVNYVNHYLINKFNECWVPDYDGSESLAGILSQSDKLKVKYIGPLSRFQEKENNDKKLFDILIVLSGPEPQRSILEEILLRKLANSNKSVGLVRGIPSDEGKKTKGNITVFDSLNSKDLFSMISQSDLLISRSGYSTVMDLFVLGGKVVFIPTPGQPEQEYLALRFKEKGIALSMEQSDFDLNVALLESKNYTGFQHIENDMRFLRQTLSKILN